MEEFLPSEVARAVYGYLTSEGCDEAARVFLDTSAALTECKQRAKTGKKFNTFLLDRNLTELLNIAYSVHSLVLQANKKKQTGEDKDEGWSRLFDELRSFILLDAKANLSSQEKSNDQTNFSRNNFLCRSGLQDDSSPLRSVSQPESHNPDLSCSLSQLLNTPKRPSLAENYKNLVQECNEGLDLSLTPEKNCPSSSSFSCSSVPQANKPVTGPSTLTFPEIQGTNQLVGTPISGVTYGAVQAPQVVSTVPSNLPPGSTLYKVISSAPCIFNPTSGPSLTTSDPLTTAACVSNSFQVTSTCPTVPTITSSTCYATSSSVTQASIVSSQPEATAVTSCFPQPIVVPTQNGFHLEGISQLPDPPIILLNEQHQPVLPFDSNDPSASFFNVPPSAASTPHQPQPTHYAPQDTAIIIYPSLVSDIPVKKTREQRKARPVRQTRLRRLLPKPPRKDPPDILHIHILPQQMEEEIEEDINSKSDNQDLISDAELAEQLPNVSREEQTNKANEIEKPGETGDAISHNINISNDKECEKESTSIQGEDLQKTKKSDSSEKEVQVKTPKPPVVKKHISRSTPRRNSHVRALSFNTPHKPLLGRKANTSPKMPKIRFSPNLSKLKLVKRSSLFKSPPNQKKAKDLPSLIEEDEAEESNGNDSSQEVAFDSPLSKLPIATRSPAPKLSTAWKEVNDVTINETPIKAVKPVKGNENPTSKTEKPQWDEKIRSFICGDFVDPVPPPKKEFKGKQRESESSLKKETEKSSKTKASVRRSQRLTTTSESPMKSPLKNSNKNKKSKRKLKQSSNKLKFDSTPGPSKPVLSKTTCKTTSKRNKKIITPAMVKSSNEDTSSSSSDSVSKSVTTGLKRDLNNPSSSKIVEKNILNSKTQNDHSKMNFDEHTIKCNSTPGKSKPAVSKTTNKTTSKRNKKIITPAMVKSSTEDTSSSSDESVSKSVTTGLNKDTNNPSTQILEKNNMHSKTQNDHSETNCGEVLNKTFSDSLNPSNNILLDDLVVSSNSCFPPTFEESNKEQHVLENILTDPPTKKILSNEPNNQSKINDNANEKSISPKFALPVVPVQETPLKDFQPVFLATPVLNTPLMKTIRQETSVLEEDLLLTPSLPPTPQVTSPRTLCQTPAKPMETVEIETNARQNSSSEKEVAKINEPAQQTDNTNMLEYSGALKVTEKSVSDQSSVINMDSDTSVGNVDKQTMSSSQNRSSSLSKGSFTSSSESSDEEIMNNFLNRNKINQPTFKPTIKTRIIQGPVQSKPKGQLKKKKIYTSTDSSDEENNDNNVSKTKIFQPHEVSDQNVANLRSMLLENERKRIERSSKKEGFSRTKKTNNKLKSKVENQDFIHNRSVNPKRLSPKKKESMSVQSKKSLKKGELVSPKGKSNSNENKIIKTPEKIREQLENDLWKKERRNIFGEDLQLSSESDSEEEIFEKKRPKQQQKKSTEVIYSKSRKDKEVVFSDESSNESVEKEKSSKSVRFETQTQIRIFEESISKSEEVSDSANIDLLKNITEDNLETPEKDDLLNTVTIMTSSEIITNVETNITKNSSNSQTLCNNSLSDESFCIPNKSQTSTKNSSSSINQQHKLPDVPCIKNIVLSTSQPVVGSNYERKTTVREKENTFDERDCIVEMNLPKPLTADIDNNSLCTNSPASESANGDESSPEAQINVVSDSGSSQSSKAVSLNLPKFDPDYKAAFETENGVMICGFSKTMFHLQLPIQTNQESFKRGSQKPRRGNDGKRRIKLTPVGEGKYEQKLKVDYDIIDGKIISTREHRYQRNEIDVLDCTCSTIDSLPDINNGTNVSLTNKGFEGAINSAQVSQKNLEESKTNSSKFKKDKSKSDSDSLTQNKMIEKRNIQPLNGFSNKQNETLNPKNINLNNQLELNSDPKENKLIQQQNCHPMKKSLKYKDTLSKIELDRRKDMDLKHRKKERDSFDKFEQKDYRRHSRNNRREDDRRRYTEKRYYRSPDRFRRSPYDRRPDLRKYHSRSPPGYFSHRNVRYNDRRRDGNRFSKPNIHWKDVDAVEEQANKSEHEEDPKDVLDPRAQQLQLTTYSDVEKNSSSDEVDSLMDFAVMAKSKGKGPSVGTSQSTAIKETVMQCGQSSKRKASSSEESILEASQDKKKLKMEEKDLKKAKTVLKHKMADMLNVLHPDTSNEAS